MKKSFKLLTVAVIAFGMGISAANIAISDTPSDFKVAVVDVQKVVRESAQVKQLNQQRQEKNEELAKFLETAKNAIIKEKDEKKKKALETKYDKEFQAKRTAAAKDYETKLLAIDKNMSDVINAKAKSEGYSLVLTKDAVLTGGTDITEAISKEVK